MSIPEIISATVPAITLAFKPIEVISKHVMYPFQVSKNVRSLDTETARLTALKFDTETRINIERGEYGEPTAEINQWLAEVRSIEEKAAKIQPEHQQLGRCLWNISPNPWSYYQVSRSAAKKQPEVKSLRERAAPLITEVIIQRAAPLAQEMPASSSKSPYLDSALANIKNAAHSIIGIWGMGGVGKTHLLQQVNNELFRDAEFSVVIFITCSKDCSAEKVQNEIINKLQKNSIDSTQSKQNIIYNSLKQHNFVILLDDLWSPLDLKGIGIPDPKDMTGTCKGKVIVTTRSSEVCGEMGAKKKITVDALNWDDAWSLFKENVTDKTIDSHPLIKKIAFDVAKELGGLPLALITVGRAMHDCFDPNEWEHARLPEVKLPYNDEAVFQKLKFSYDNLRNETLKQCFLHCSLWPEDYHIKKDELIELWMGIGMIDEFVENEAEVLIQQETCEKMKSYKFGYKKLCAAY